MLQTVFRDRVRVNILASMSIANDRCGINAPTRDSRQDTRPGSVTHGQMQYKRQHCIRYNPSRVVAKKQDTNYDSRQQKIKR